MSATIAAALLVAPVAAPQALVTQEKRLVASDPANGAEFGSAADLEGDTALVGAPAAPPGGAAYVLVRGGGGTWKDEAKLVASDGPALDFGDAVALAGDTALVGAPRDDLVNGSFVREGSAYVFVRSGTLWSEQAKLTSASPAADDRFGWHVALHAETAVVGAPYDDVSFANAGSVHVFARGGTTWSPVAVLTPSTPQPSARFGSAVGFDGTHVVVGAEGEGNDSGAAYVFRKNEGGWVQTTRVAPPVSGSWFGASGAISSGSFVIGAYSGPMAAAYVYAFDGTGWRAQGVLRGRDTEADDLFGSSVAIDGSRLAVGARFDDHSLRENAGSAYLFGRQGTIWAEQVKLVAAVPEKSDRVGSSVAVSGTRTLVGAPGDDVGMFGDDEGTALLYDVPATCLACVRYCTAGTSSNGCAAAVNPLGAPSASAATEFWLTAAGSEGSRNGLFFYASNGRQAVPWGNGTSYQCVAPPVKRAGLIFGTGTVGTCQGGFVQDMNELWANPAKNPGSGAVVQAQLWYRDHANTSNQPTSLSDAVEFTVLP